jgi:hypothetical protein
MFSAHVRLGFTCEIKTLHADAFKMEAAKTEDES